MRSWGSRDDTVVIDEPFYASYLKATGKKHPGSDEIIGQGETDPRKVIAQLTAALPDGKSILFQKQMTHHLLPAIDRGWISQMTNCFLIRAPAEVTTSYIKKNDDPEVEDLGFVQQLEIFERVRKMTEASQPIVLDAKDVLQNPERMLRLLCAAVGVPFDSAMLSWSPGLRETDGVWAKHWYGEVAKSTCFQTYQPKNEPVPERLHAVHDRARQCYERLYEHRLR